MWSDLNLNFFFAGKSTVGAVLDWTALTNTHSRGGWWYSHRYRSPLQGRLISSATPTEVTVGAAKNTSRPYRGQGGWKHQPPLQRELQGRSGNRSYRGTLCRNTLGGAAGAAAPTEALEPPLQLISVVVNATKRQITERGVDWSWTAEVGWSWSWSLRASELVQSCQTRP